MSKQKCPPKVEYIAIEDLISHLGLEASTVYQWINRDKPETRSDHRGRESVPRSLLDRYSHSDDYLQAFREAVFVNSIQRKKDGPSVNKKLAMQRRAFIERYRTCITDLEALHRKYLDAVNKTGHESCTMAAYLLFSRVIATLKMACLCLENGYWYCGSLMREIDESINVALFFTFTPGTQKGNEALHRWFRQNIVPKDAECRREVAKHLASLLSEPDPEQHQALMGESYYKKSKWTHPSYRNIREITEYNIAFTPRVEKIDYGPCGYERMMYDLTRFYESSVWTSFTSFFLCFHLQPGLTEEDRRLLTTYENRFRKWAEEQTEEFGLL